MDSSLLQFPDLATVIASLTSVFKDCSLTQGQVQVLNREPFSQMSTFLCEIVTCRLGNGRELQVLCKYSASWSFDPRHPKGGVPYEAFVYCQILRPSGLSLPNYFGTYTDMTTGSTLLVVEYLHDAVNLKMCGDDPLTPRLLAARWLGEFHTVSESLLARGKLPKLKTYNAEDYLGWAERTLMFAGELQQRYPWLATVCRAWENLVEDYLLPPQTIIHGEFYSANILFQDGIVYPVDWESAAIAVGEIDLAFLIQFYPPEIVDKCKTKYQQARWPDGTPPEFEKRLAVTQLFAAFRWLGARPEWTVHEGYQHFFGELYSVSERLGLL